MDIQRIPPMNSRRGWNVLHGKGLTGEKSTIVKTGVEDMHGSDFGSRYNRRIAFCGGVLISSINSGRRAGQKTVVCQSFQRPAPNRILMSAG
jgi:hypothetical protein